MRKLNELFAWMAVDSFGSGTEGVVVRRHSDQPMIFSSRELAERYAADAQHAASVMCLRDLRIVKFVRERNGGSKVRD